MSTIEKVPLTNLFELDETLWLEIMSHLAAQGRFTEMDHTHLSEYLADMAKRDRREVSSRLVTLLTHLLKWKYQADQRNASWHATILEQRRELRKLLDSGTLRNHAQAVLAEAYEDARKQAAAETKALRDTFPKECEWDLATLLADEEFGEVD